MCSLYNKEEEKSLDSVLLIGTFDHFLCNMPAGLMYATLGLLHQLHETSVLLIKEAECDINTALSVQGLPKWTFPLSTVTVFPQTDGNNLPNIGA